MERLTDKNTFEFSKDEKTNAIYNKLALYEDIDEYLGVDMPILINALTKGISYNGRVFSGCYLIPNFKNKYFTCVICGGVRPKVSFKDFGKTWIVNYCEETLGKKVSIRKSNKMPFGVETYEQHFVDKPETIILNYMPLGGKGKEDER